ncbi:hypothetical protein BT63DRAFT_417281 [Microthyrium microscopicum]|uniref:Di-copper centre-containing protein n=1 Tax=Microthyrium microscopicum TaxID=703497 RepID=A0A6A6U273_9PEZI|nr:hypothetical protein BT63DRAFT_417281 [Microthyrium microscopicum]
MKSLILSLAVAANVASATKFVSAPEGWTQSLNLKTKVTYDIPRLSSRDVLPPKIQQLKSRNPHIPGSKTVKVRYGPYTVPGARVPGGEGMIENRPSMSVDKPCQNCMLLGMNAGLEYPDGSDANTNTMMWLHHMVMFNIGKGAWDATCTIIGAPHLIVGSLPSSSERFFSSGNERTTTFFNPPWANVTNLGYPIYPADRFGIIVDLMNMNNEAKPAYLTIYYDFVDDHPATFDEVKPVWLDAFQCMTSELSGRTANAKFDFAASPWITNFEGEVLGAGGHLHDGGTHLDLEVDKQLVCTSTPTYGTDEQALARADIGKAGGIAPLPKVSNETAHVAPKGGHGHGSQHIIAMSICADNKAGVKELPISPLKVSKLVKGQSWVLKAYYDYNLHPGMKSNSGGMSTVMGISIMYAKTATKRVA